MICKYCHENTHYIDVCPIIICKICKDIGHPQWLCIKKKNNNKLPNNNNYKLPNNNLNKGFNDNNTKKDLNYINKKDLDDGKNESFDNLSDKNLNYYIKNVNESWDTFFI